MSPTLRSTSESGICRPRWVSALKILSSSEGVLKSPMTMRSVSSAALVLEAQVDPVGQHAELGLAACQAVAPARMGGEHDEVEVAGAEGAHVGRPPERLLGEVLRALLGARRVDLGGEAVEGDGAAVEQEADALAVAAGIGHPVGIDQVPARPEDTGRPGRSRRGCRAARPGRSGRTGPGSRRCSGSPPRVRRFLPNSRMFQIATLIDLVELGGRDLRRRDTLPEREQAGRDVGRNVSVVHMIPRCRSAASGR